jgi:alanine racemase
MYHFSLQHIAHVLDAKVHGIIRAGAVVSELAYDSRKIIHPEQTLFIALKTPSGNGHSYIKQVYDKGGRYFLVSENMALSDFPDAVFLQTDNTLQALQNWAKLHRSEFKGKVLAITGSYGKTITKEWLQFLLSAEYKVKSSPGSFNSSLGIPLSLLTLSPEVEWAIIEAGISEPGEMRHVQNWIQPDAGIFTHIGEAHLENFNNVEHLVQEKMLLFSEAEYFIHHKENTPESELIARNKIAPRSYLWSYSELTDADIIIKKEACENGSTILKLQPAGNPGIITIHVPFSDEASLENACHCAAFCYKEGMLTPGVIQRFSELRSAEMRMQRVSGINGCTLLNDTYSADLSSLRMALQALAFLPGFKKRSLILTDIRLHGHAAGESYLQASQLVNSFHLDKTILIGKEIVGFKPLFSGNVHSFLKTEDFLELFPFSEFSQEAILVKGIHEYNPQKIVAFLERQKHETLLEVDLDALGHNVKVFKKMAGGNTRFMAMVKAFSYGTGSIDIANHLKFLNIDYLAVAYTDEGTELRKAGIDMPIMVMNPGSSSVSRLLENRLEPEIFSFRSLEYFMEELNRISPEAPLSVHLKIDTGMHRLGFSPEEAEEAAKRIAKNPHLKITSVFSHLASSENSEDKDFTLHQIRLLNHTAKNIETITGYPFLKHIANSAAISNFPEAKMDMVRLGIGMYGITSSEMLRPLLKPVLRLKTIITQIRKVPKGETVGYDRAGIIESDSLIATLPVGYADGYRRNLGMGKGKVYIAGKLYPVIGKVCMDMLMVNITGCDAREGDEVILFGPELPIEQIAQWCGTIPYEILTGISPRVKRVYLKD